jgi:hypothetical protein
VDRSSRQLQNVAHNGPFSETTRYVAEQDGFRRVSSSIPFDEYLETYTEYTADGKIESKKIVLHGVDNNRQALGCVIPTSADPYALPGSERKGMYLAKGIW